MEHGGSETDHNILPYSPGKKKKKIRLELKFKEKTENKCESKALI